MIGRLPVLSYLNPLDKDALKQILTEPKNALVKQYKSLFDMEKIALEFQEDALNYIVEMAMEYKLGARGLRSICEAILTDAMFELPSEKGKNKKLTLDLEYVKKHFESSNMSKLKTA